MGRVFRAEHGTLGREVALKVLRPELATDPNCVDRFFAEARTANQIRSEHLVAVTDLCRDPSGDTYLVMELLEGMDLYDLQASARVSVVRVLRMMRQLCDVVARVHEAGIVHRDLKPENVFVTQRDGQDFIKLLDFGIAKDSASDARTVRRTAPGILIGTPQYMAPEQATASAVDYRADLYALGVILFQLLSDRLPFETTELADLLSEIAYKEPPLISQVVRLPASVSTDLDALVACCLRKNPARRPQSALEIAEVLDELLGVLVSRYEGSLRVVPDMNLDPAPNPTPRPAIRSLMNGRRGSLRSLPRPWLTHKAVWGVAAAVALASVWQLYGAHGGQLWTDQLWAADPPVGATPEEQVAAATAQSQLDVPALTTAMQVVTEPLVDAEQQEVTGTRDMADAMQPQDTPREARSRARPSDLGGSDRRAREDARSSAAQAESPSSRSSMRDVRKERRASERLSLPHRDVVLNPFLR